jgi:type I restriction enzyme S subunit
VLRIPNVIGDTIDTTELKYIKLDEDEAAKLRLQSGDLLFVRTNGRREYIGRCAVYKGNPPRALFASYLIRARLRQGEVNPDFFQMYSTTATGRVFLSGRASSASDGKFNINTQILRKVMLPRPPLQEQQEIVHAVEGVQGTLAAHQNRMRALDALFQTLLHNLMTGKVRVHRVQCQVSAEEVP